MPFNYPITQFLLCRSQHQRDRLRQALPICPFALQLPASRPRQLVEFGVAARFGGFPFGLEPSARLETVESRIERALLDLKNVLRDLLQPLRNGVAVQWAERGHLKNQHVERALEQVG